MELEEDDQEDIFDPDTEIMDFDKEPQNPKNLKRQYNLNSDGDDDEDEDEIDSDAELQDALLAGQLKPGLHAQVAVKQKMDINNETALKAKLQEFKLNLAWVERLDVSSNANDLPPNVPNLLAEPLEELSSGSNELDLCRNDIKRELIFAQQARASVFKALQSLRRLKVKTKRPADYFAEMLKTEEHMGKVLKRKQDKVAEVDRRAKARTLREQKKLGKKIQVEVLQQRHREKREFNEKVKKLRTGQSKSTDFLDEKPSKFRSNKRKAESSDPEKPKKMNKREYKDTKYGNGGRKRDQKKNTADSASSFDDFRPAKHSASGVFKKAAKGSRGKKQKMRSRKGN
jgi:rRNA-processing protein EBP2